MDGERLESGREGLFGWGAGGQGEEEGGYGSGLAGTAGAADAEGAVVAVEDLAAHPEAEAGAVVALGAEEGFEHALLGFGVDAAAVIGYGEEEAFAAGGPVGSLAAADEESAAGGHGVDGVGDEAGEDVADVGFVALDEIFGALAFFDVDAGVAQAGFIDVEGEGEEIAAGDLLPIGGVVVKAEGLGGDVGDAAEFELGLLEPLLDFGNDSLGAGEVEEVGHGFEGIVDLVGHAGGEAADGGELLALDESGDGALVLEEVEAGFDEGHDLAGEGFEAGDLEGGEVAGLGIDDADGAEDVAVGGDDGGAGVEADVGIAGDEGVVGEAGILLGVGNDEGAGGGEGVGAEALGARGMGEVDADFGLEPLAVFIDEGDEGDGGAAEDGGEGGGVVELWLGERVEDGVTVERG